MGRQYHVVMKNTRYKMKRTMLIRISNEFEHMNFIESIIHDPIYRHEFLWFIFENLIMYAHFNFN